MFAAQLSDDGSICNNRQKYLRDGGFYVPEPSVVVYLLANFAVAAVSFCAIFGLTYLLPALARRYWKWLNT